MSELLTLSLPPRTDDSRLAGLPVAIIGAGPVGLAAAAQLQERGIDVVIFEAGGAAGAAVSSWGHTRLFTPWEYLIDAASARLLTRAGWQAPADLTALPLGRELVERYLVPLAATPELAGRIRFNSTVVAVSRQGMDRSRSTNRAGTPFVLRVHTDVGTLDYEARAVIDGSGTHGTPNGLVASGLDPLHADEVRGSILPALPDVLGADRARFTGRHTLVVGAGHSAANTLIDLARLADDEPDTTITWAIRTASPERLFGSEQDELAARGSLGARVQALVELGRITRVDRFEIDDVQRSTDGRVAVVGRRRGLGSPDDRGPAPVEAGGRVRVDTIVVDLVVTATGFRPDLVPLREIRLSLDEIVEAPRLLAPLIDPNLHSCGTVPAHGVDVLTHPEPNFYIAGMKSFGRAPTFLLATGYEQVRSIADELAGNWQAARTVALVLPETGVCSTGGTDAGSCCA
ncbi:FAD-dependent oxidoreductase [Cryobacterium sp. Hz9]|uniref:FAD-dependent oxidoreductase n=1 Tax=Cryobacterium sp. Hz9 TaxID=1259167 RepID=UPI00106C285B|nr:FAD-dependent oxidoreductase [Cryobacterium sp. Hz9]TFB67545.1 FAD-dependent oxidoreductase [Cryobacterium sp. Hz9]